MSEELKPCPFCDGGACTTLDEIKEQQPDGLWKTVSQSWGFYHECKVLGVVHSNRMYDTEQEAISAWNTRANEPTCKWIPFDEGHSFAGPGWYCSNCYLELGPEHEFIVEYTSYCPGCRAEVVD